MGLRIFVNKAPGLQVSLLSIMSAVYLFVCVATFLLQMQ